jgi:hypothetical protein
MTPGDERGWEIGCQVEWIGVAVARQLLDWIVTCKKGIEVSCVL